MSSNWTSQAFKYDLIFWRTYFWINFNKIFEIISLSLWSQGLLLVLINIRIKTSLLLRTYFKGIWRFLRHHWPTFTTLSNIFSFEKFIIIKILLLILKLILTLVLLIKICLFLRSWNLAFIRISVHIKFLISYLGRSCKVLKKLFLNSITTVQST